MTISNHEPKKKFVLIFPAMEEIHLHKDVGQIPFQMQKHFGYEAEIVCHKNQSHYDYLDGELKGLQLTFIRVNHLLYLAKNARKIDVLMLFHIKTETIYATLLYKLLNPKGVVYVKYDLTDHELGYAAWGNKHLISQVKRNVLFKMFLPKLDIFSVECRRVYDRLTKVPAVKKIHLPNGFDPEIPAYYGVVPRAFESKENIILLVGRHGSRQKNSELLLTVLAQMGDIGDWQVVFIGPMTDKFQRMKTVFMEEHPAYQGKIHFLGAVSDKKILFEYYDRAKIFCLPSRWESWGLVCVEALCFGNVLIMSKEVEPSFDLTDDGRIGFAVAGECPGVWVEKLTMLMHNPEVLSEYSQKASEYFHSQFIWKNILTKLHSRVMETIGE